MAIQLGCNYSAPLKSLIGAGSVDVDWIKVSVRERLKAELTDSLAYRPVLLHVLDRAGSSSPLHDGLSWDILAKCAASAGSPHHAIHFALEPDDAGGSVSRTTHTETERRNIMDACIRGIQSAQRHSTVPVLVENVPYYGFKGTVRCTAEPESIHEIIAATDTGLILDLAHVRVTADHLGTDERSHVDALPLDSVREIHVTGPRYVDGQGLRDLHYEMLDEDFALLEYTLEKTNPGIVTLEYGGTGPTFETEERNNREALMRQLVRLTEILGRMN